MNWQLRTVFVIVAVACALALAAGAGAGTTGSQAFSGFIVTSGASGERHVVSSTVLARGAFTGAGHIVEVDNLPSDPDNVSRDDLVFAGGSIHLVSVTVDVEFSLNPGSCVFNVTLQQFGYAVGGTGQFASATGSSTATVSARGVLRRATDGSCSLDQVPLSEVDKIESEGTLSY